MNQRIKKKKYMKREKEQEVRSRDRPNQSVREMVVESIRALEGEGNERKFALSFSSEEPYRRFWGVEILEHTKAAIKLDRLNAVGCLLWNHHRDAVIGKITRAWIEDGRGMAEVEFDEDEKSETILQKVKSGTLKGVSVGYSVDSWEDVAAGAKSTDGRFAGPVSIAKSWTPLEISIVSVPADPTVGVGRETEQSTEKTEQSTAKTERSIDWFWRQVQLNQNISKY